MKTERQKESIPSSLILNGKTIYRLVSVRGKRIFQRIPVDGEQAVVLAEPAYRRLLQKAGEWEPLLPARQADGTYPAIEYARVSLARKIIRQRRRLGFTQAELARRAGIRPETLNRIEQGKRTPSVASVEKIDKALRAAENE